MSTYDIYTTDTGNGVWRPFEDTQEGKMAFDLFSYERYPDEPRRFIEEVNRRGQLANEMYKMSQHREQLLAIGFQAGMYMASFDENEQLTRFELSDGTRQLLGYDGPEDLPNEFDSWVKVLIPEEREQLVRVFRESVKKHRELPDFSHVEYRMRKKDGSIIWVTGAGKFIRREDGTLETYIACYRDVTAEHEKEEYLHIIEGVGKIFDFSIYIDAKTQKFRIISSNDFVDQIPRCENAFEFLRASVDCSDAEEAFKAELKEWFQCSSIFRELKENGRSSKDFYDTKKGEWLKGSFMIGDYDEDGEIAHVIYGCQNINDTKQVELENQKEIIEQYRLLKSVSDIYHSMHEIDLVQNTVTAYKAQGVVSKIVNHTNGADLMMRKVMSVTTDPQDVDAALEFTDLLTLPERLKNKKVISAEFKGNNIGWFAATFITVMQDEEGRASKVIFTTNSIDEIKRKEEKLIVKSNTDELTGAFNRRAYDHAISELVKNGLDDDFVYISLDLNGLKIVNDSIGHNAGDELIIGAYNCLLRSVGVYGTVFRTGGDEFIIFMKANSKQLKTSLEALDFVMERWSGKLSDSLSMSYGCVARAEVPDMSIQDIALLADKRMYEEKNAYYRRQGFDRRGQKDAHTALCGLYTKILKINLTNDTYQIVNMDMSEQSKEKGFSDKISVWLRSFGESGQVHPDDLEEYLAKTSCSYLSDYFSQGKTSLHIFYRRKYEEGFKQVMMEIIPANDYSEDCMSLFLYVKNIDV